MSARLSQDLTNCISSCPPGILTNDNNLGLLSAADDKPFPENNIKGEPCMQAASFWRRKSKGVVTDKMEETFLSQPSKESGARDRETIREIRELGNSSDNISVRN